MSVGIKRFIKGLRVLLATYDNTVHDKEGAIWLENDTTNRLKTYTNGAKRELVTNTESVVLTNKSIDADNNTITNIDNADIKAAAAIDASKIADGSVSSTEFQYLSNVTGDIQSQIGGKEPTLAKTNLTESTSSVLTISNGTGAVIGATPVTIEVDQADTSNDGYLSSTDWNTFNGKEPAVAKTNLTETTSSILTISNGTGAVIGASPVTIAVQQANTSNAGYLSSTDWNTFNGKQAAGAYITASSTDQLTNKDFAGGTASDTLRITVPKNTKTNLDGLTRKEATLVYASDLDKLYVDNGSDLVEVGSGGGAGDSNTIALLRAADLAAVADLDITGQNAAFDGGGTITASSLTLSTTAADLILSDSVIKYAPGANGQNDYFGFTQAIPQGLRGRTIGFNFDYKNDSTVNDNDFRFCVKIKDGASAGYIYYDNLTKFYDANNEAARFQQGYFIPADCTEIEFGWQNTDTTTTIVFMVDNILVSSNPVVFKNLQDSQTLRVNTGNGYGSTNNKIRRFTNVETNIGSQLITYTDSAANGGAFTVNKTCNAVITFTENLGGADHFGISRNSTELTTSIKTINIAHRLTMSTAGSSDWGAEVAWSGQLNAGDVIRAHTAGYTVGATQAIVNFTIMAFAESENIVSAANSTIEEVYYDGYSTKDGSNFIKFKTQQRSTASKLISVDNGTRTKYTALKKLIAFPYSNIDSNNAAPFSLIHFNAAGTLKTRSTNTIPSGYRGIMSLSGILMEMGDYLLVVGDATAPDDADTTNFGMTAVDFYSQMLSAIPTQQTCYIKDVKSANTASGTFTSGAWQTRVLNVINETGSTTTGTCSFVTLSSNQFSIQPGTYDIVAEAPAYDVDAHKAIIYNITTSADEFIGSSETSGDTVVGQSKSVVKGRVTITVPTTYELRHRCTTTSTTTNGFGIAANLDSKSEVYAQISINKIK